MFVVFGFILSFFIAAFRWPPLCYKQSPVSTQKFQKKVLLFLQLHMKNTLFVTNTASPITTTRHVFLPNCKYHIILPGEIEEMLHKMDTFSFTYQHVDCLYNLFKYRFSGKLLQRGKVCLTNCKGQSPLTKETEEWTKCRVLQKRDSREKISNIMLWVLSKRTN